jgi:hypothetical protein
MSVEGCLRGVPARALRRGHAQVCALAVCLGALAFSPAADAAVTIGQLPPGAPSPFCATSGLDYLQPSVTGGNLYVAKQAGTITSWTTNSSGAGATYVFKIFRRTTDPDSFQVIAHAPMHTLSLGMNTVPVNVHVESGDMIGFHESGPANSCAFSQLGDNVLNRSGNLDDGAAGTFMPQNDVRLNLSAVLVPDNTVSLAVTKDRKRGTATVTATTSNPGVVAIAGKGMKKRASKTIAVAGPVNFPITTVGKTKHKLERKGRVALPVRLSFLPNGGEASTQSINLKLRRMRPPTSG